MDSIPARDSDFCVCPTATLVKFCIEHYLHSSRFHTLIQILTYISGRRLGRCLRRNILSSAVTLQECHGTLTILFFDLLLLLL